MKLQKMINRKLLAILLIIIIAAISNWIVRNSSISTFSMFNFVNLFTYFGVLIGFSLTIYTFGLSMVTDIKTNIEKLDKLSKEKKANMLTSLLSGFSEIKQDIWLIFYSIIGVIYFGVAKEIVNPFGWEVEKYMIPETINITLFITTTISMFDIMRTLFNLSEINLELIRK